MKLTSTAIKKKPPVRKIKAASFPVVAIGASAGGLEADTTGRLQVLRASVVAPV